MLSARFPVDISKLVYASQSFRASGACSPASPATQVRTRRGHERERESRLLCAIAGALLTTSAATAPGTAQLVTLSERIQYEQHPGSPGMCSAMGQWLGPWNFEGVINPLLREPEPSETDRTWAEIAHAIVLPPPPPDEFALSYSRRVLLIPRRHDLTSSHPATAGTVSPQSFIWDLLEPDELTMQVVDPNTIGGVRDPFCGGHALTKAGNVFVAGGVDEVAQLGGGIYGTRTAYLFMNEETPRWVAGLPEMEYARWYPSVRRASDGSFVVAGHAHNPDPVASQYHERVEVDDGAETITWRTFTDGTTTNASQLNVLGFSCSGTSVLDTGFYPRLIQLAAGGMLSADPDSSFLDLDICSDPLKPSRFATVSSTDKPHHEPNFVHYIDLSPSTGPVEFVYSLGGGVPGQPVHTIGSHQVLRMDVNASAPEASTWSDTSVPQLKAPRLYGNAVILLDGSILMVGGVSQDEDDTEYYATVPERYRPPGIFATPDTAWHYMNEQAHERTYHSVAVLLPTGVVLSAGGQGTSVFTDEPNRPSGPVDAWYSVELFRPPYMCSTSRPVIVDPPATMEIGEVNIELSVKMQSTATGGEARVALIGPGSTTHAMDNGQVYIKLKITSSTLNEDPAEPSDLTVDAPAFAEMSPPGWYLLTVVNAEGLPSAARWIQVVDEE